MKKAGAKLTSHGRFRANVGTMQNGRTIQVRKY